MPLQHHSHRGVGVGLEHRAEGFGGQEDGEVWGWRDARCVLGLEGHEGQPADCPVSGGHPSRAPSKGRTVL